jgi:hypothetical protein
VVTLEMLRMVAPKGCLLIPSYLKFSISRKRAMILCLLVRSYDKAKGTLRLSRLERA